GWRRGPSVPVQGRGLHLRGDGFGRGSRGLYRHLHPEGPRLHPDVADPVRPPCRPRRRDRRGSVIVVGWMEFCEAGATLSAILDAEGGWSCEAAPHIAELLGRECPPVGDPSDDAWGHDALIKAARRLHGIAWLSPGRPVDQG